MAENSKIEWTHHTANLWWGCEAVHSGCDNCYAEVLANRYGHHVWGNDVPRKIIKSFWKDLNKFQKAAKAAGEIHRVFIGSMMDIFEKPMPLVYFNGDPVLEVTGKAISLDGVRQLTTGDIRTKLFNLISQGSFNNLEFLFLTKRPSNINKFIPEEWKINPPPNVMYGTSPVDQKTFDTLVGHLLKVNGKRFLSMEPQLDHITLGNLKGIDWIIQGGESGHKRRPFNTDWARSVRDECKDLHIPYFFKQVDKVQPIPEDLLIRQFPQQPQSKAA